ncbi:hypothetical protein LTR08_003960 [Meristemomyces frigidus]|nr:hypothetical protein LTR08_003960 [Meristemomyces frigidus]
MNQSSQRYVRPGISPQDEDTQWKIEVRHDSTARQLSVVEALASPLPPDDPDEITEAPPLPVPAVDLNYTDYDGRYVADDWPLPNLAPYRPFLHLDDNAVPPHDPDEITEAPPLPAADLNSEEHDGNTAPDDWPLSSSALFRPFPDVDVNAGFAGAGHTPLAHDAARAAGHALPGRRGLSTPIYIGNNVDGDFDNVALREEGRPIGRVNETYHELEPDTRDQNTNEAPANVDTRHGPDWLRRFLRVGTPVDLESGDSNAALVPQREPADTASDEVGRTENQSATDLRPGASAQTPRAKGKQAMVRPTEPNRKQVFETWGRSAAKLVWPGLIDRIDHQQARARLSEMEGNEADAGESSSRAPAWWNSVSRRTGARHGQRELRSTLVPSIGYDDVEASTPPEIQREDAPSDDLDVLHADTEANSPPLPERPNRDMSARQRRAARGSITAAAPPIIVQHDQEPSSSVAPSSASSPPSWRLGDDNAVPAHVTNQTRSPPPREPSGARLESWHSRERRNAFSGGSSGESGDADMAGDNEKVAREMEDEHAANDRAADERAARERAANEWAANEWAAREHAAMEWAANEWAAREHAAREHAAREHAAREHAAREHAVEDGAANEHAGKENSEPSSAVSPTDARGHGQHALSELSRAIKAQQENAQRMQLQEEYSFDLAFGSDGAADQGDNRGMCESLSPHDMRTDTLRIAGNFNETREPETGRGRSGSFTQRAWTPSEDDEDDPWSSHDHDTAAPAETAKRPGFWKRAVDAFDDVCEQVFQSPGSSPDIKPKAFGDGSAAIEGLLGDDALSPSASLPAQELPLRLPSTATAAIVTSGEQRKYDSRLETEDRPLDSDLVDGSVVGDDVAIQDAMPESASPAEQVYNLLANVDTATSADLVPPPAYTVGIGRMPDEPDPTPFLPGPFSKLYQALDLPQCHHHMRWRRSPPQLPLDMQAAEHELSAQKPGGGRGFDAHVEEAYNAVNQLYMFTPSATAPSVSATLAKTATALPTPERKRAMIDRARSHGLYAIADDIEQAQKVGHGGQLRLQDLLSNPDFADRADGPRSRAGRNGSATPPSRASRNRSATPTPSSGRKHGRSVRFAAHATRIHTGSSGVLRLATASSSATPDHGRRRQATGSRPSREALARVVQRAPPPDYEGSEVERRRAGSRERTFNETFDNIFGYESEPEEEGDMVMEEEEDLLADEVFLEMDLDAQGEVVRKSFELVRLAEGVVPWGMRRGVGEAEGVGRGRGGAGVDVDVAAAGGGGEGNSVGRRRDADWDEELCCLGGYEASSGQGRAEEVVQAQEVRSEQQAKRNDEASRRHAAAAASTSSAVEQPKEPSPDRAEHIEFAPAPSPKLVGEPASPPAYVADPVDVSPAPNTPLASMEEEEPLQRKFSSAFSDRSTQSLRRRGLTYDSAKACWSPERRKASVSLGSTSEGVGGAGEGEGGASWGVRGVEEGVDVGVGGDGVWNSRNKGKGRERDIDVRRDSRKKSDDDAGFAATAEPEIELTFDDDDDGDVADPGAAAFRCAPITQPGIDRGGVQTSPQRRRALLEQLGSVATDGEGRFARYAGRMLGGDGGEQQRPGDKEGGRGDGNEGASAEQVGIRDAAPQTTTTGMLGMPAWGLEEVPVRPESRRAVRGHKRSGAVQLTAGTEGLGRVPAEIPPLFLADRTNSRTGPTELMTAPKAEEERGRDEGLLPPPPPSPRPLGGSEFEYFGGMLWRAKMRGSEGFGVMRGERAQVAEGSTTKSEPGVERARGPELALAMKRRAKGLRGTKSAARVKLPEAPPQRQPGDWGDEEAMSEDAVINEWQAYTEGVQWGMGELAFEPVWAGYPSPTRDAGGIARALEGAEYWGGHVSDVLADGSGLERAVEGALRRGVQVDARLMERLERARGESGGGIVRGPGGGVMLFTEAGQRVGGQLEEARLEGVRARDAARQARAEAAFLTSAYNAPSASASASPLHEQRSSDSIRTAFGPDDALPDAARLTPHHNPHAADTCEPEATRKKTLMAQNACGVPNGASAAAIYSSGMHGSVMPAAGHPADMQTLMQNMDVLAGWLKQNRDEWGVVQEGLGRVEAMRAGGGGEGEESGGGGHVQSPPLDQPPEPTNAQLQTALAHAHARIHTLESTLATHADLQSLYEDTLVAATDRIRAYAFEQSAYTLALHKHYTALLAQSRGETLAARCVHQEWQARLGKLAEGLRGAVGAREAEGRPWVGRVRGLGAENRVLRRMVGWEVGGGSEDEGEEEGGGGNGGERGGGARGAEMGF